jgi:alkylation response protein AidB-like acyl-CoA dehydrogenase
MSEKISKGGEFLIKSALPEDVFTPEDFNPEQREIANMTEKFILNEVIPKIEEIDSPNYDLVAELMKKTGELGLFMTSIPEEYGGLDLDKATEMLVTEKIGPAGSFSVAFSAHTGIGILPLLYYGTEDQKQRYLEKLITGEWIGAYCLTEPNAGSDALNIRTTAKLSEDGKFYILNGTKQFISNAGFANLFTVFAKVDGEHFTAFLVEADSEGLSLGPEEKKMGMKGSSTREVIFDNVKVPVENLLGEIGKGHKIAFNILNVGRFKLGAAVMGASKYALTTAIKYANERVQFGKPISQFGAIKEKIARMTAETFASESTIYRLAGLLDDKLEKLDKNIENYYEEYQKGIEEFAIECSIAKVYCSDVLAYVVDEVVQIYGGYGYIQEYPADRFYRDERINRIFEGTNEINRMLISGMLLKRSVKGQLPLQAEVMKALDKLMNPSFDTPDFTEPFSQENYLLENLKTLYLILAGSAVQKYGDKLSHEQEILMSLADVTMHIFALESSLLRIRKHYTSADEKRKKLLEALAKVITFYTNEKISAFAKKTVFFVESGDNTTVLLSGIRRFTKYDASGLLEAQRIIADTLTEAEKYIF